MGIKMKQCTKCKKCRSTSEFHKHPATKDGLRPDCKICRRFTTKRYRRDNKERLATHMKKYRQTIRGCLIDRFHSIKGRCDRPNHISYKNYGARGIRCLFNSSDEFVNYVINELNANPHGLEIDRIDNDGHYEPGNIRFVTKSINLKNTRRQQRG